MFEPGTVCLPALAVEDGEDLVAGGVAAGLGLLADLNAIEGRLRDVDVPAGDELGEVAVEDRQQQRADVIPVGIGIPQ